MPISKERFDYAEKVVESGVKAAHDCLQAGKGIDTVDMLVGGFGDRPLHQEGLLELLVVAMLMIVKEREEREAREDILRG